MRLTFKHLFKLTLIVLFLGIFVSGFIILNRTANPLTQEEKKKVLNKLSGGQLNLSQKTNVNGSTKFQGKYYTFLYPSSGVIYNQNKSGSDILENFSFDIKDFPKIYFYTEVKQAPWYLKNIDDYSGISFRLANPQTYNKKTITIGGIDGLLFEKSILGDSEGFERIAYILVNGKIYSFSSQSVDQQAEVDLFNSLISTVKFIN